MEIRERRHTLSVEQTKEKERERKAISKIKNLEFSQESLAEDEKKAQENFNKLFTKEKREKKLDQASKDTKGRTVRYYRYMTIDTAVAMLEEKKLSSKKSGDVQIKGGSDTMRKLGNYFSSAFFSKLSPEQTEKLYDLEDRINLKSKEGVIEIMKYFFSKDIHGEIDKMMENLTLHNVRKFADKHLSKEYIIGRHQGGADIEFSPYLSLSAGGVIKKLENKRRMALNVNNRPQVYVEYGIDDSNIEVNPTGANGEKEVLTRELDVKDIMRIYMLDEQLKKEVLENEALPIGQYKSDNMMKDPIEAWRWGEDTTDCVPESLQY